MTDTISVNRYVLRELPDARREELLRQRAQDNLDAVTGSVEQIVGAVRERGDAAVVDFNEKFDGVRLREDQLLVTPEEFDEAERLVDPELRAALEYSVNAVSTHHRAQVPPPSWMKETAPGVLTGERVTPIASVGLYVPRGKGSFPSVMIMLCAPAVIAGVPEVVVCTPPAADGTVDAASLVAARLCGVRRIVKAGGAHAVAAMAYGTATVPKVDKILGPGNQYVTAARRLLSGVVNPGPPAGPSESIVLCDEHAEAETVARELLVEAEHGEDSAVLLVTHAPHIADAVARRLPELIAELPERRAANASTVFTNYGGIVVTDGLDESLAFVNDYAPEHLRVLVEDPFAVLPAIQHAGEVLLGPYSSIPYGNFSIGVNAILPTGRTARSYSCMGVEEMLKRSSFAYVSPAGVRSVGPPAVRFAAYEGFPAHEAAASYIVDKLRAEER